MNRQKKMQTLKGFRDFLPQQAVTRNKVKEILVEVFESYGFEPLETPTLEYQSVLLGKYGEEADKLVYTFEDKGNRKVGLRYDLTVPLARVAAQYQYNLPLPFKRYQIQSVFRADKPQKGRYREFTQCDIDTVGSSSPLADAEIIAVISTAMQKLGFSNFMIRLNSRQVLFKVMEKAGIPEDMAFSAIQTIDKLDKKQKEEVEEELIEKGLKSTTIKKLFIFLNKAKPDKYLLEVINLLPKLGVNDAVWKFDPILARGLDYYTGPIFETVVKKPNIGSLTGGGRYDKLISQLGGPNLPAAGTTIGLERVVDVILEKGLWQKTISTPTQILVVIVQEEAKDYALEIATNLRKEKINTEIYLETESDLAKQLKYADKKSIPYAVIVGKDEAETKNVQFKNLKTGKQQEIIVDKVLQKIGSETK